MSRLPTWGLARVSGASMEPTLYDGDRLLVRLDERARLGVRVGQVAVVRHPQGYLAVKRVTAVAGDDLAVESDNAGEPGAWSGLVEAAEVVGVVRARVWPVPRVVR